MAKEPKISAAVGAATGRGQAKGDGRAHPLDKRLTAQLAHGGKFPPGDPSAAKDAHTEKTDKRHAQAIRELQLILNTGKPPDKYRTAGGRIKAKPLAEDYVNHPILRAPLRERSLRALITRWDREGKLAKTPT